MFGSRKNRRPYTPATPATVNPNAATAAASAFHLSSAAAAAAIRAIPLPPTNVAEVQTARTLRRSASISSQGSRRGFSPVPSLRRAAGMGGKGKGGPGGAPTLRRKGSASSMSERSFRSASPHHVRNASAAIAAPSSTSTLPPSAGHGRAQSTAESAAVAATNSRSRSVPAVLSVPKPKPAEQRQTAGLEMAQQSLRVASQQPQTARGSWFGGASVGGDAATHLASRQQSDDRPSSRSSSVNFSYPSRARVGLPPPGGSSSATEALAEPPRAKPPVRAASTERAPRSSFSSLMGAHRRSASTSRATGTFSQQDLVYDPNSRRMVPRAELLFLEQEVLEIEEQMRLHKKKQALSHALSHAAAHPTKGTAARAHDAAAPAKRQEPPRQRSVPAAAASSPAVRSPAVAVVTEPIQPPTEATAERDVDELLQPPPALSTSTSTPSSSVSSLAAPLIAVISPLALETEKTDGSRGETPRAEDVGPALVKRPSLVKEEPERENEEQQTGAEQSNNPARTAHFAPVSGGLTVQRYSPPPRSISPRKSAMKHAGSSPGDSSPTEAVRETAVASAPQKEKTLIRKKSNRVSFIDENTAAVHKDDGSSSSSSLAVSLQSQSQSQSQSLLPAAPDPQPSANPPTHRRLWFSNIGRSKKNDAAAGLDDDQVMRPRPALPSFGSIRERVPAQVKQPEERALMRPPSPASPATPSSLGSPESPERLGTSSDHAVGLLLAQEQTAATRNTANTSRYREPLPPVVTSVDGGGYASDSDASTISNDESEASLAVVVRARRSVEKHQGTIPVAGEKEEDDGEDEDITPIGTPAAFSSVASKRNAPLLPAISLTRASRESLDEAGVAAEALKPSPTGSAFDVPGTFPPDLDHPDSPAKSGPSAPKVTFAAAPTRQDMLQLSPAEDDDTLAMQPSGSVLAAPMPTVLEEPGLSEADEDDTDTSIYTDAFEDLSEMQGDGFLSLNAVVESPVRQPQSEGLAAETQKQGPPPSPPKPGRGLLSTGPASRAAQVDRTDVGGLSSPADLLASQRCEEDDWEKVKAFWRSLSVEKRAQLELAAREEATAEGDREEVTPEKRPRQKKSAGTRAAEMPAVQSRQARPAEQQTERWAEEELQPSQAALSRVRRSMREARGQEDPGQSPDQLVSHAAEAQPPKEGQARRSSDEPAPTPGLLQGLVGLRRRGSDSSESSFKRSRGSGGGGGGGDDGGGSGGLRKTMRRDSNTSSEPNRSSRFSLRSLSPAGSALRGPHVQSPESPQLRKSLRDGANPRRSGGMAAGGTMRTSSSVSPAAPTLRGAPKDRGLFSSVGRSGGSKLLRRDKNGPTSRFGYSSDEDDDTLVGSGGGGVSRNKTRTSRLDSSTGVGGAPVRSRFADSSDDDDDDLDEGLAVARNRRHTMSTSLRPVSAGGARASNRSLPLPEELDGEDHAATATNAKRKASMGRRGVSSSAAFPATGPVGGRTRLSRHDNSSNKDGGDGYNIGTSSIRRSRSGRGQMVVSPTHGAVDDHEYQHQHQQSQPKQHRRLSSTSSFMSVLRRKKNSGGVSHTGGGGRSTENVARRNSQLERGIREAQTMRSSSSAYAANEDDGDDSNDVLGGSGAGVWPPPGLAGGAGSYQTTVSAGTVADAPMPERKKKKFPALRRMFRLDD